MDALTDCLNGFSNADDDEVIEQAVVLLLSDMFRLCEALCEACVPILSMQHWMASIERQADIACSWFHENEEVFGHAESSGDLHDHGQSNRYASEYSFYFCLIRSSRYRQIAAQ